LRAFVKNLFKVELSLALILSISFLGLAIPYGFPLFSPLVLLLSINFYREGKLYFKLNLGSISFYVCIIFYILGMIYSGGIIYDQNKAEVNNIISICVLLPIIMSFKKANWRGFINIYSSIFSGIMFLIAIFSLCKFYLLLKGVKLSFLLTGLESDIYYPWGTSLVTDYNMFSYAMFGGVFASAYCLSKSQSLVSRIFYFLASSTMILSILWSGSRRGWIVLAMLMISAIYLISAKAFMTLIYNKKFSKRKALWKVIGIIVLLTIVICVFNSLSSGNSHSQTSKEFGKLVYRFSTIYGENSSLTRSFSDRTMLLQYANTLISKYSIFELLFGQGFDYIREYGSYVNNTFPGQGIYVTESYPHNPIVSAILYSGMIGALCVLVLMLFPFLGFFKQRKLIQSSGLLSLYLVSLLFLIPASNTIFSIKPFLLLLGMGISLAGESIKMEGSS
jgi:hypothetical protein